MIDEGQGRELTQPERKLILSLLSRQAVVLSPVLENARVIDMQDGGMGSIRFIGECERRRTSAIACAEYADEDGVLVSIELSADQDGELFEIDFWKVDFSQLRRYPSPEDLRYLS